MDYVEIIKSTDKDPKDEIDDNDCNYGSNADDNSSRDRKENTLSKKEFCCHICGNTFTTKGYLKEHIRVHEGRRFICSLDSCYAIFTTKLALQQHKLIHTGEKPLICKICNKTFRQRSALWQHRKVHTGEKPYGCKVCQRKFSIRNNLITHFKIHTKQDSHAHIVDQNVLQDTLRKCIGQFSFLKNVS